MKYLSALVLLTLTIGLLLIIFSKQNFGAIPTTDELEQDYFVTNGKYLQVQKNNQLPEYETGTVRGKLGRNIDPDCRVDVYEGPKGKGFQVVCDKTDGKHSVGYGPEASGRTWFSPAAPIIASTTP